MSEIQSELPTTLPLHGLGDRHLLVSLVTINCSFQHPELLVPDAVTQALFRGQDGLLPLAQDKGTPSPAATPMTACPAEVIYERRIQRGTGERR